MESKYRWCAYKQAKMTWLQLSLQSQDVLGHSDCLPHFLKKISLSLCAPKEEYSNSVVLDYYYVNLCT